jgi:glycosyltransferase involved in cell wall biosynthesis
MDFSIIIANHNDHEMCDRLLHYLLDTDLVGCKLSYEIIIVNDGSDEPYLLSDDDMCSRNIIILNRNINLGVGDAFDWGVERASGKYVILMGADVFCGYNGWVEKAIQSFDESMYNGMGIMCFSCYSDNSYDDDRNTYGARIVWKMDGTKLSLGHRNRNDVTYRDILQGEWMEHYPSGGVGEISCLMGACYLTTKDYYNRIRGFNGHRAWGGLEPMISLKTLLSGGKILVNGDIIIHHTFTRHNKQSDLHNYYANKIFMAQSILKPYQSKELLNYFCNISVRKELLKLSYSYLYQHRDLINYLGDVLCYDVRDIEILNWGDE